MVSPQCGQNSTKWSEWFFVLNKVELDFDIFFGKGKKNPIAGFCFYVISQVVSSLVSLVHFLMSATKGSEKLLRSF